jgi:uncharacterized protein
MNALIALAAGLVFGLGLMVSGMSDPAKVLGFLDLAGFWDPSLAFVIAGAVPVAFVGFRIVARRSTTPLGEPIHWPRTRKIDARLVLGSALFGIGWGLAGICPGPAFVLLGMAQAPALIFLPAMLAGMGLFEWHARHS